MLPLNGSSLVKRNIWVDGHRTSIRLEHELWEALTRIALRDGLSVNDLCTAIDGRRTRGTLTSAIRSHLVGRLLTMSAEQQA